MVKFDEPEVREEGIKRILAFRYVFIHSYKTGWSTCANLFKNILKITSDFTKYY